MGYSREKKILGKWVSYGYSWRRFALAFCIDKYTVSIDLVFIWVSVEF